MKILLLTFCLFIGTIIAHEHDKNLDNPKSKSTLLEEITAEADDDATFPSSRQYYPNNIVRPVRPYRPYSPYKPYPYGPYPYRPYRPYPAYSPYWPYKPIFAANLGPLGFTIGRSGEEEEEEKEILFEKANDDKNDEHNFKLKSFYIEDDAGEKVQDLIKKSSEFMNKKFKKVFYHPALPYDLGYYNAPYYNMPYHGNIAPYHNFHSRRFRRSAQYEKNLNKAQN